MEEKVDSSRLPSPMWASPTQSREIQAEQKGYVKSALLPVSMSWGAIFVLSLENHDSPGAGLDPLDSSRVPLVMATKCLQPLSNTLVENHCAWDQRETPLGQLEA